MSIHFGRHGTAVLALVDGKPGHLLHWCEGCGCCHVIDIRSIGRDGRVLGWDGCFIQPTIAETVRHVGEGTVCEYELRAGVMSFSDACTHALAGLRRALKEIPA